MSKDEISHKFLEECLVVKLNDDGGFNISAEMLKDLKAVFGKAGFEILGRKLYEQVSL